LAGLLDDKSRVIDAILTLSGRSQAMAGGLRVRYVTLSDSGFSYVGDSSEIAVYSSASLGLECFSTPWDTITVETDESGMMLGFAGDNFSVTPDGKAVMSGSLDLSAEISREINRSSLDSFKNLQVISTRNKFLNDPGLSTTPNEYAYTITNTFPFAGEPPKSSIDDVDNFFTDKRLSNLPNFRYLPPTQRSRSDAAAAESLGNYANLSEENDYASRDPIKALSNLEGVSVKFSSRTEDSTLAIQIFEEGSDYVQKLDVVRYGPIGISPEGSQSVVYFLGKVYEDGFKAPTFVNIFTMVLE
jgi:hypothetical protein